jgi:hypothetical protein
VYAIDPHLFAAKRKYVCVRNNNNKKVHLINVPNVAIISQTYLQHWRILLCLSTRIIVALFPCLHNKNNRLLQHHVDLKKILTSNVDHRGTANADSSSPATSPPWQGPIACRLSADMLAGRHLLNVRRRVWSSPPMVSMTTSSMASMAWCRPPGRENRNIQLQLWCLEVLQYMSCPSAWPLLLMYLGLGN